MADKDRKQAPQALGTGILRRAQLPATGIERLRRPHVEEKEIDDDENSGEEYDDDDEVSLDGNVPLNLETLLRDWKKFDSAKTTTQQRRKIAISHGFQNITEFREYMRQQEIVETCEPTPQSTMDNILMKDLGDLKFTWQTWDLQPKQHRKDLARKYGFSSIGAFEEYLSLKCACQTEETTKASATCAAENDGDMAGRNNYKDDITATTTIANNRKQCGPAAVVVAGAAAIPQSASAPPKKKRKRRRRIIPRSLVYKKRK